MTYDLPNPNAPALFMMREGGQLQDIRYFQRTIDALERVHEGMELGPGHDRLWEVTTVPYASDTGHEIAYYAFSSDSDLWQEDIDALKEIIGDMKEPIKEDVTLIFTA